MTSILFSMHLPRKIEHLRLSVIQAVSRLCVPVYIVLILSSVNCFHLLRIRYL